MLMLGGVILRKSRQYEDVKKSSTAPGILIVILIGIAVYFFVAGSMGKWFGENVVTPVFSFFEQGDFVPEIEESVVPQVSENPDTISENPVSKNIKTPSVSVFALQTGAFSNMENANSAAQTLKSKGGAGYVIKDGELNRVLISSYLSSNEAVNVMARLDEQQSIKVRQFAIEVEPVSIEVKADEETVLVIEEGFNFIPQAFQSMQDLSFSYDGNKMEECESVYNDLTINLDCLIEHMEIKTNGTSNTVVLDELSLLKSYRDKIKSIDLASEDRVAISSKIKYTGIDIIYGYKDLIDSF